MDSSCCFVPVISPACPNSHIEQDRPSVFARYYIALLTPRLWLSKQISVGMIGYPNTGKSSVISKFNSVASSVPTDSGRVKTHSVKRKSVMLLRSQGKRRSGNIVSEADVRTTLG